MSEYVVIYEQADDGGWGAYLPDLPGVVALGSSRQEAVDGIREALTAYVEDLQERGLPLPAPHHAAETIAAAWAGAAVSKYQLPCEKEGKRSSGRAAFCSRGSLPISASAWPGSHPVLGVV